MSLNSSPEEAIRSETLPLPQLSVLPTPCCLSKCGKKVPQTPSVGPRASQDFKEALPMDTVLSKAIQSWWGETDGSV